MAFGDKYLNKKNVSKPADDNSDNSVNVNQAGAVDLSKEDNEKAFPALPAAEQSAADARLARRAVKNARKAKRNEAFTLLQTLVNMPGNEEYKAALVTIKGKARSGGIGGTSARQKFIDLIQKDKVVDEMVVFKELHIGRKDCAGYIRKHLRTAEPENRVWVAFDSDKGEYSLAGTGEDSPKDWIGFIPPAESIILS